MENWKDIEGYEGLYQVSSKGRIKSLNYNGSKKEKILKCPKGHYYKRVSLVKNGIKKTQTVHRLVASAFIPNPENKPCIDHINTDPMDNRVCNLRWVTHKENMNNPITLEHRPKGENHPKPNLGKFSKENPLSKPILQFDKNMNFIKRWDCFKDIERTLNLHHPNILKVIRGIRNHTGGYKWGYADDYERIPFKVFDLDIYRKKWS